MINANAEPVEKRIYVMVVLGAAIGMFAGFPPLFNATAGMFMQPLSHEFSWGRSETALSYSMSMLGLGIVCPLVGNMMDRFGVRRVILISAILFGLCVAAMSFQNGSKPMWIGLSLLIGIFGAATSVMGYLAVLPQWFDRRLGLALALSMFGLGLGTIVMPAVAQHLIANYGWRTAYACMGMGSVFFSLIAYTLMRERLLPGAARNQRNAPAPVEGMTLAEGIRSWRLWVIFLVFFVSSMATISLNPHLPAMLGDKGFTQLMAARAVSLMGVGLITGRFLTGILLDRMHAPYVACLFFVVGACGVILIKTSNTYPVLLAAFIMLGLTIGAEGDLVNYLVRSYFGLRAFGTLYGIGFAGYAFGGVVGPVLIGKLFDAHKNYELVLSVFPWMLISAGAVLLTLGKYRASSERRQGQHLAAADR